MYVSYLEIEHLLAGESNYIYYYIVIETVGWNILTFRMFGCYQLCRMRCKCTLSARARTQNHLNSL